MVTTASETRSIPDVVPESSFGVWFLGTETWSIHVLKRAIVDLERLIKDRKPSYPVIVDVGCGWGQSFKYLSDRFSPEKMIGIDTDEKLLEASNILASKNNISVDLRKSNASSLPIPSGTVDMIFCHQTLHHLVDQEGALGEFNRVLKPGGLLLLAESTRKYIHSWVIRLLFRHDMDVQRSAAEYLAMLDKAGFEVDPEAISYPYLWWSRADFGLPEWLLGIKPPLQREETLINLVASRR